MRSLFVAVIGAALGLFASGQVNNPPSASQVGALPLAGGTMTGPILGATNLVTATLPTNYFVFEGDSRVAGGPAVAGLTCPNASNYSNGTSGYSCSLPGQVSNTPFFLNHGAVYNEGIGGTTIAQMNTNYPTYVHALSPAVTGKTGQLFIQTGYNDISASTALATMESGIQSAWSAGHTDGWPVVMTTMIPGPGTPAQLLVEQQFNNFVRANSCASQASGTTACWDLLVDYAAILPDNFNPAYFYTDNTHPLSGAYTLLAAETNLALASQQSIAGLVPVQPLGSGSANYRSDVSAMTNATTGSEDTAIGVGSCAGLTTGQQNECIGAYATVAAGAFGMGQIGPGNNNYNGTLQFTAWNFLDNSGNIYENLLYEKYQSGLASGTTIAPASGWVNITGTTPIATITVPSVLVNNGSFTGCLDVLPTSTVATTTAGNIFAVYSLVGGNLYRACWNGTKWYFTGPYLPLAGGTLNGPLNGPSFNSVVWIDGTIYTTLASALAALPSTGGTVEVPPNYTETVSSDITISNPMTNIHFNGPAVITLGTHTITTPNAVYPSASGLSISGPVRGSNDVVAAGMPKFVYTGTGTAISLGNSSTDQYGITLTNFAIDISGAGSAAKALGLQQVHEVTLDGVEFNGTTSTGKSQECIDSNGAGSGSAFNSYQTFKDIFVYGCTIGTLIEGGSNIANNANTFIGGSIQPASDGTALYIADGGSNNTLGLDVHNATIGVRFGANALRNSLANLRIESNTADVQFDASSTYDTVMTSSHPVVTDNSGPSFTNWASSVQDKPTNILAYYTATAASGNLQANLQPYGNQAIAGTYRICGYAEVTTVATGGTYGVQVLYTDDAKAETFQLIPSTTSLTALGATNGCATIHSNGSANIVWKLAVASLTGTPSYTTFATLERLSVP